MFMLRTQKAVSAVRALFYLVALCIFLLGGCSKCIIREISPTRIERGDMLTLSVDFQDGFVDDAIVLLVNGQEVFYKQHVRTKLLLGLADSLKTKVETGPVSIETNVPTKDIAKTIALEVSADTYIGISIANGMVEYIVLDEPFGYG